MPHILLQPVSGLRPCLPGLNPDSRTLHKQLKYRETVPASGLKGQQQDSGTSRTRSVGCAVTSWPEYLVSVSACNDAINCCFAAEEGGRAVVSTAYRGL